MSESHVISALKSKRSEFLGLVNHYEKELRILVNNINHIDNTLKIFDPNIELSTIKPKQYRKYNKLFRSGELSRLILEVFRDLPNPLTCEKVSEEIKKRKKLEHHVKDLIPSVRKTIGDYGRKGVLKAIENDAYVKSWMKA